MTTLSATVLNVAAKPAMTIVQPTESKEAISLTFGKVGQSGAISVPAMSVAAAKKSDPMAALLRNQMESCVAKMAADGTHAGEGKEAALAQVAEMMSTINLPAVPARTRTKKVVQPDCRCMARVWGGGLGTQCTFSRKPGCGDYCSRCHKKAQECAQPLQFTSDGKHKGLFWGRIDEPKPIMSDGHVVVQWKDDECAAKVAAALAEGKTFHPFSGEAKKKVKGPRKPRAAKKSKAKKPKARRAKNAFFWFLGEKRAEKKAELIAAAAEGEKVGVADVTKALGAIWKTMDEAARAPYVAMETEDKAKAQQELEASLATINQEAAGAAAAAAPSLATPAGLGNDEVPDRPGLANASSTLQRRTRRCCPLWSWSLRYRNLCQIGINPSGCCRRTEEDEEDEEDGESVEEHTLADGTVYYLGSDGTLYDTESHEIAGTLNSENNTLIPQ